MKEKIIENGIEYVRNGDYHIPNLTVPDDKVYNIGKYGRLHSIFIVEYIKDPLARDIPSVDNSLFILARKLILESR